MQFTGSQFRWLVNHAPQSPSPREHSGRMRRAGSVECAPARNHGARGVTKRRKVQVARTPVHGKSSLRNGRRTYRERWNANVGTTAPSKCRAASRPDTIPFAFGPVTLGSVRTRRPGGGGDERQTDQWQHREPLSTPRHPATTGCARTGRRVHVERRQ